MKTRLLFIYFSLIYIVIASCGKEGLQGPEGAAGPAGVAGPAGAKGDTGSPGPAGPAGTDGSIIYGGNGVPANTVGKAGDYYLDKSSGKLYGPKTGASWGDPIPLVGGTGQTGATGATGAAGTPGSKIFDGTGVPSQALGAVGDYYLDKTNLLLYGPKNTSWGTGLLLMGAQGVQGPVGPPGADGSVIYSGTGVPSARLGQNGDYYFDKSSGGLYGPKTAAGWGTATSLKGPDGSNGSNGTNGSTILSGNGAPSNTVGQNGDFYLDISTYLFYGPKAGNTWGTRVLLKGAQGPQGPVGPAGADGSIIYSGNGAPGAALGNNGDYYFDKTAGALYGPKTNTGWSTPTVLMGATGATGANGTNGNTVLSGSGIPSNTVGKNGDYYLDITTYRLYGPKSGNAWSTSVLLMGAQGAQGPVGPAGADGSIIYSGNGVPNPSVGATGDYYFDKTNRTLYGPKGRTGWGTPTSLVGATGATGNTGAAGANGNTILNGTGAPANTLGNDGDFYLDVNTYLFYGPKTAGAWGAGVSLKTASSGGANVTAFETLAGSVLNWAVPSGAITSGPPTTFVLSYQKPGGPLIAANSFKLPDSVATSVDHGIVLVYLHITPTGANSSWIQLSYTNALAPNNLQYYTFKTITSADGLFIEVKCDIANTSTAPSAMFNIDKVRVVVVPGTQAGDLGTTRRQPLTHTMQQLHLSDKSFKSIK
ncbi:collagen-like domain-containing protein [Mucilaginibacter xinganensis]|uniref:Collagen-like protein n=1 Tax=Mucilaginibacter xinganensis TaxID=1234841 RepID=A0A223NRW3_9SPHI|nr:hypothetical protein [Mucilaginibacter xinganensis]ASU32556.1 hypothetical protein MuYL_0653 [Mucilaginibacter xinganensis]